MGVSGTGWLYLWKDFSRFRSQVRPFQGSALVEQQLNREVLQETPRLSGTVIWSHQLYDCRLVLANGAT